MSISDRTEGIVIRNENNGDRELIPELRLHILKTAITLEMKRVRLIELLFDQEALLKAGVTAAILCSIKLDECEEDYIEEAEEMVETMERELEELDDEFEDEQEEELDRELDEMLEKAMEHARQKSGTPNRKPDPKGE